MLDNVPFSKINSGALFWAETGDMPPTRDKGRLAIEKDLIIKF